MNFRPENTARRRWIAATLDITPLVDVIFQLLIFFFYTANFIQNPNIPVNLPEAAAQETATDRKDRIVTIQKDGKVLFDGQVLDIKDLKVRLSRLAATEPDIKLLIRSDSASQVGTLVAVMEAARESGLRRFGIATRGTPGAAPGQPGTGQPTGAPPAGPPPGEPGGSDAPR
ncbi:MAG: biopolymer transporter ExbD [Polyangia bacterium]|jgi:biopolymer transport protein ExbD|nr:biopolymer transporter ExbD [Polyangia bacterium]